MTIEGPSHRSWVRETPGKSTDASKGKQTNNNKAGLIYVKGFVFIGCCCCQMLLIN